MASLTDGVNTYNYDGMTPVPSSVPSPKKTPVATTVSAPVIPPVKTGGFPQNLTPEQFTAITGNKPTPALTQAQLDAQNAAKAAAASGSGSSGSSVLPGAKTTDTGVNPGQAPSGSKQSANGNWVDSAGNQYAQAPADSSGSSGISSGSGSNPLLPSLDTLKAALGTLGTTPAQMGAGSLQYQDQALADSQAIIDNIERSYNEQISEAAGGAAGASAAAGMAGSPQAAETVSAAMAPGVAARAGAVATAMENIRSLAASQYKDFQAMGTANAQNTVALFQQGQTQLQTEAKSIAANGKTPDELKTESPDIYQYLLEYGFNGNEPLMQATMLSQNQGSVINTSSPIQTGTNFTYIVQSIGADGKPVFTPKTLDLSSVLGKGETPVTYGGNTYAQSYDASGNITLRPLTPQKPISAGAYGSYVLDPKTGEYTLQQIDPLTGLPSSTGTSTSVSPEVSSYITNVSSSVGVDPSTPLSTAITSAKGTDGTIGIGAIVEAQIKAEGGSLPGVLNNPGNIKYAGLPGQTDSGVKAADGGTFASYSSMEAGKEAMAAIIQDAADGNSTAYGPNPTLADYLGTYSNTTTSTTNTTSTSPASGEYGLLSTVPGFNPSNREDAAASTYIQNYLSTGKIPSASQLGFSSRAGGVNTGLMSRVAQRAKDLYFQATGQQMPNATVLAGNLKLINGNNKLLNTIGVQSKTIISNFGLNLENITANDINTNSPIVNGFLDQVKYLMGDPDVAQYLNQESTLQNEMSSLIAVKNASGTTVADKLMSAGLIDKNASVDQQVKVLKTIMQEAMNGESAIKAQNVDLYSQTDPLQVDPQNPLNNPMTFTKSDGSSVSFNAGSLTSKEVQDLVSAGYSIQ